MSRASPAAGAIIVRCIGAMLICLASRSVSAEVGKAGITATNGSAVIGGNAINSPITINGLSEIKAQGLIEASGREWRQLTAGQRKDLARLQSQLGITAGALQTFFATLGEQEVPPERIAIRLGEIAGHYLRLKQQVLADPIRPEDAPELASLKRNAKAALDVGNLTDADGLLQQIESLQDGNLEARMADRAATAAQRGTLAMTQLRYAAAAAHFAQAGKFAPAPRDRAGYLAEEAQALFRQGDELGDNDALEAAIARYGELVSLRPRKDDPLLWARTQMDLGVSLNSLGGRENGNMRLEQAVESHRRALLELTRERAPLDWARAQMNLGNALESLGERDSDTRRLLEAVTMYRSALLELPRDRQPLDWAAAQESLGNALQNIGSREQSNAHLEEAVAVYQAALREFTRERVPLHWASAQVNLGIALQSLGERQAGTTRLKEAILAYDTALLEFHRDRVPLEWANAQMNRGMALQRLAERTSNSADFDNAITAYSSALQEMTMERVPRNWAWTQVNLGSVLASRGERDTDTAWFDRSAKAYGSALLIFTRENAPLQWAAVKLNLAKSLALAGERQHDSCLVAEAQASIDATGDVALSSGAIILLQYTTEARLLTMRAAQAVGANEHRCIELTG